MFLVYTKIKSRLFQILGFEEYFRKVLFLWRIGADGRPNRNNVAAFSIFSGVVWTLPSLWGTKNFVLYKWRNILITVHWDASYYLAHPSVASDYKRFGKERFVKCFFSSLGIALDIWWFCVKDILGPIVYVKLISFLYGIYEKVRFKDIFMF